MEAEKENQYRPQKRSGHVTVVVGKFLFLWGGFSDEIHTNSPYEQKYLSPGEMWVYHSDTDQWINVMCNGHPPPGLAGARAVIVGGGLYILFGHSGRHGRMNGLWRMDLMTKNWEEVITRNEEIKPSLRDKGVAWTYNNKIYWFGGYGSYHASYLHEHGDFTIDSNTWQSEWWNNQLLEFDTEEKIWTDIKCTGDVPLPRAALAADKFEDSSDVYIFGGRHKTARLNDLFRLDLKKFKWTRLHTDSREPEGRSWHTFSAVSPKYFLLVGGYTTTFEPLRDAWVLDVELVQWTEVYSPLTTPRLWHTASVTCDNEVLVFGGSCNDIMDSEEENVHTNELVIFRLAPKSLLRLCLDTAFTKREQLQRHWDSLPRHLSKMLQMRLEGLSCDVLNTTQHQARTQGRSCVIS